MSHREVLESELQEFQIDLSAAQKSILAAYCDELTRWNGKINLTGLRGADMVRRLVVEPAWIGLQLQPAGALADIGSGNGSPAIPLHVVGDLQITHLIESRIKRAAFLRHVIAGLKLSRVEVHRSRFEDISRELGPLDWITLQGVALSEQIIDSIRQIAHPTTTIVWITSPGTKTILKPQRTLRVPLTGTDVLLFRLDLP